MDSYYQYHKINTSLDLPMAEAIALSHCTGLSRHTHHTARTRYYDTIILLILWTTTAIHTQFDMLARLNHGTTPKQDRAAQPNMHSSHAGTYKHKKNRKELMGGMAEGGRE